MRQWFQGKLAERLLQAGQMAQGREMLRRGALKMQDGTLGQPGEPTDGGDQMEIRVGDEVHYHTEPAAQPAPAAAPVAAVTSSLLAKAAPYLVAGALGASGVGLPWALASLAAKPAADAAKMIDTDTQYILDLVPTE